MSVPSSARVRKRRLVLRKAGLRPVQLWVPDTRRRGFGAECRRQSQLASEADRRDDELTAFMDAAADDLRPVILSEAKDLMPTADGDEVPSTELRAGLRSRSGRR